MSVFLPALFKETQTKIENMLQIEKGKTIELYKMVGKLLPKGLKNKLRQATYDIVREIRKIKNERKEGGVKVKKGMPQCNYCSIPNQAEWSFVYGNSPTNHYAFSCTDHIGDMIKSISKGKHGEVMAGYLAKWNTANFYDPNWNKAWEEFYNKLTTQHEAST